MRRFCEKKKSREPVPVRQFRVLNFEVKTTRRKGKKKKKKKKKKRERSV